MKLLKISIILFALILTIFFLQIVVAQTQINIYLTESGDANFYGKTSETLKLPEGIYIKEGNIFGTTNELTKKDGEVWFFNYSLVNSDLNVIFPKDAVIKDLNDGEISLEEGKFSVYNYEKLEVYYYLGEHSYINYYIFAAIIVLFLILLFIIYRIVIKKTKSKNDLEIIKKTLNERENLILDKLTEVKEIKQSRLSKITTIPKASLFRHLIQLERKSLIKRKGEGKNKIISLK